MSTVRGARTRLSKPPAPPSTRPTFEFAPTTNVSRLLAPPVTVGTSPVMFQTVSGVLCHSTGGVMAASTESGPTWIVVVTGGVAICCNWLVMAGPTSGETMSADIRSRLSSASNITLRLNGMAVLCRPERTIRPNHFSLNRRESVAICISSRTPPQHQGRARVSLDMARNRPPLARNPVSVAMVSGSPKTRPTRSTAASIRAGTAASSASWRSAPLQEGLRIHQ